MKKISVLMPTYNDSNTIEETLDSLLSQEYTNWELIIIDDGSSDNTKEVIENYKAKKDSNNKIKYIKQENKDQLLAIINGMNFITGEYIYILHSDDLLYDEFVFSKAIKYLDEHPNVDAILSDLTLIDENSNVTRTQKILPYLNNKKVPAIQLLWLGRNLYTDLGFYRKDVFVKNVCENYLTWNRPFWLNINDNVSILNCKKVDFCFFKYRVYEGNYANNEIGKLCLINGELRTATQLMAFYNIPFFKFQYFTFRVFCHLKLYKYFRPVYNKRRTKNKYEIIDFIIRKRYPDGYESNKFLNSLALFYKNKSERKVDFDVLYNGKDPIYLGNSFRIFNKELVSNKLPNLYYKMFDEMEKGFKVLSVSKKNLEKALNLTKFLCIYPFVEIRCKEDEK